MFLVIDGNIGSGKTTQLKMLSYKYNVRCEPIDEWPLKNFYEDKSRWAFLLQMTILKSFVEDDSTQVWERSPESSKYVFWKMLRNKGIGTDEENSVYSFFYDKNAWKPKLHIYIRTNPEKCFERIQKRHQEGDSKITLEYIKEVHEYYEEYISGKPDAIIIDGNDDDIEKIHKNIEKKIGHK